MRRWMVAALVGSALAIAGMAAADPAGAEPATSIAPSPDMSVAAFLMRVNQLRQLGPEWPRSPEAGELLGAISTVGKDYRKTLAEKQAAGQPVEACLRPRPRSRATCCLPILPDTPPKPRRAQAFARPSRSW